MNHVCMWIMYHAHTYSYYFLSTQIVPLKQPPCNCPFIVTIPLLQVQIVKERTVSNFTTYVTTCRCFPWLQNFKQNSTQHILLQSVEINFL